MKILNRFRGDTSYKWIRNIYFILGIGFWITLVIYFINK